MARREIVCPTCRQVNVRYSGLAALMNPRSPEDCTLCGTNLTTGERAWYTWPFAMVMWTTVYLLHVMVGVILLIGITLLVSPGVFTRPVYTAIVLLIGGGAGVALAEHSRRRGTLLSKPRRDDRESARR